MAGSLIRVVRAATFLISLLLARLLSISTISGSVSPMKMTTTFECLVTKKGKAGPVAQCRNAPLSSLLSCSGTAPCHHGRANPGAGPPEWSPLPSIRAAQLDGLRAEAALWLRVWVWGGVLRANWDRFGCLLVDGLRPVV